MESKSKTCRGSNGNPLTEYLSKGEAEGGARYVQAEYGRKMVSYRCHQCDLWHLSPADRYTPNRYCAACGKDAYESRDAADKRAGIIRKEKGVKLKTYACPYEAGWHLTRRK